MNRSKDLNVNDTFFEYDCIPGTVHPWIGFAWAFQTFPEK